MGSPFEKVIVDVVAVDHFVIELEAYGGDEVAKEVDGGFGELSGLKLGLEAVQDPEEEGVDFLECELRPLVREHFLDLCDDDLECFDARG